MSNASQFIPAKIETENIILKSYSEGEGIDFYKLIENNRTRLKESFPNILLNVSDEVSSENYLREKIFEWKQKQSFAFGVWLKDDNKFIGHVSIKNVDWRIPRGELAYFISSDFESKGLMSEAVEAIIKFSFNILNFNRLYLRTVTTNERSIKLAEKFGFKREGLMPKDHRTFDDNLVDVIQFGMTKEDFINFFKCE